MNTEQIAKRLVELCREGKYEQAQDELYAQDAVSVEMEGSPGGGAGNVKGLDAIREKGRKWQESIETIHGGSVGDPVVAGDWFSVAMGIDATYKGIGRMDMKEICVYQVRDGKIAHEQFFYNVG
ncbi:nuclear transport factor 2 family protein [Luteimonas gilva]|uniref:Nuclear transport factor 2 family protein n=1 Tax=Luteimonas gilva TaxID=2572684 RepID=A0A4U5JLH2_9GAMM|nr:nuclear transport factor 2 family protein [Luteimonas gilva]TKR30442.1 nuclear transport factor 2 family protein [Luteimonas gilva]